MRVVFLVRVVFLGVPRRLEEPPAAPRGSLMEGAFSVPAARLPITEQRVGDDFLRGRLGPRVPSGTIRISQVRFLRSKSDRAARSAVPCDARRGEGGIAAAISTLPQRAARRPCGDGRRTSQESSYWAVLLCRATIHDPAGLPAARRIATSSAAFRRTDSLGTGITVFRGSPVTQHLAYLRISRPITAPAARLATDLLARL